MIVRFPLRLAQSQNSRTHWRVRAARRALERNVTAQAFKPWSVRKELQAVQKANALGGWAVTLTRIAPNALDDDNLSARLKGVRDQVSELLGMDDRDKRLQFITRQEKGAVREHAVQVEIVSLAEYVQGRYRVMEQWAELMTPLQPAPRRRPSPGARATPNFRAAEKK